MVRVADRCYGISHQNKVRVQVGAPFHPPTHPPTSFKPPSSSLSSTHLSTHLILSLQVSNIDILDKETALEFVRELQSEEEALGKPAKP